jgi:hypothetical protein
MATSGAGRFDLEILYSIKTGRMDISILPGRVVGFLAITD